MRSPHYITRTEALRGAANRVLFSQFYILLYLGMALLSCVPCTTSSPLPLRRTDPLNNGQTSYSHLVRNVGMPDIDVLYPRSHRQLEYDPRGRDPVTGVWKGSSSASAWCARPFEQAMLTLLRCSQSTMMANSNSGNRACSYSRP